MSKQATTSIRVTRRFRQPAERVFDAWLDPEKAAKFLFATPAGEMVRAEIDPRVGGHFVFVDRRDGVDIAHRGAYIAIERSRRLVFTFTVSGYEDSITRVTVDIVAQAEGCEITLTHDGVLADFAERAEAGWSTILDTLARRLQDPA